MIFIVLGLAVILAVIAYNMYQENQYRKQVREQFGHSDKDALLNSKTSHVRDGKESGGKGLFVKKANKAQEAALRNLQEQDEIFAAKAKLAKPSTIKTDVELAIEDDFTDEPVQHTVIGLNNEITTQAASDEPVNLPSAANQPLVSLDELSQVELPWFDPRFDYLAYIALSEAQELHALPRLSNRHRFQIIGCTMDNRFQVAEPIPSVYYQGFVVGLQAVSRNGLATQEELQQFNQQVDTFAQLMGGKVLHTDLAAFTEVAQALDTFCARVDQTIAIHLVSHSNISGVELRASVENLGFVLGEDGAFHYTGQTGSPMFAIHSLTGDAFTNALLDNQSYKGFSMLLDIPHAPAGEKTFDLFMDLAVRLSGQLGLDLVNDKMEEVSTQWLKDIRNYVLARQEEMVKVGIKPGSKQALRLFS
ncbi:cell division protein ZipA C-terminal FtsZ-binding domain-containing protein [Neisseria mucosa]|uniref:Cell division protein ZipA n=1 Tax=Neisseria mucosa TaxID=488 RepID=A0AAW6Z7I7_NEIMU|nr:cell division protein ZipA C-terminal FtsZ-binding domain-containing protein [Neisseria mucosa]MDK6725789.1 cell division protein ZipA C-terminal FtsZ-binding domain-containing protein [Neisseria mucosa]MDK6870198.1 cell division protein ZipA C-terminal FtsZ-binding domain-containing protein [Neisseria mucosa]MDK8109844.1 cell division protein ZipA C-terminal FtsZ-binding domain-containing protein [Neisseria mucosa]MDK8361150.1 cell division protein ZipA C-terminal FtsZ-binding domain-contai